MQILVLIKEVAELEDDFEVVDNEIDEKYFEYQLNEWDEYALEAAVQIQENADGDVEVVAVTVGPERAEETVRMALAKGADRALRIWDSSLDQGVPLDPQVTARLLHTVADRESPELVFCGVMAGDDMLSATGVTLAQMLGYEWAAVVNDLELDRDERVAHVHRELEGGTDEVTDVDLPAVLTIQTGLNEPRYASLRGIRQARSKPLDVLSLEDLGLDDDSLRTPISLRNMKEPETETETQYISGSPEEMARNLAELLRSHGVVD